MRLAAFDEMLPEISGLRKPYTAYDRWLKEQDPARLTEKMQDAERVFRKTGITFAVYGEQEASERLIPFDIIPRIISGNEWRRLTQGIEQRVQALNAFLDDIYHRQEILRAGRVPEGADRQERGLPAGDDRRAAAGRRLHPHHRRRHRAHRRERVLRAGRQCAHAVRRLLHAGEPRDDDAAVPRAVPADQGAAGRELSAAAAPVAGRGRARKAPRASRPSRC